MKRRISIILAVLMISILALSGCGGADKSDKATAPGKTPSVNTADATKVEVADISGEIIDTGDISALCPDGWKNYPQNDFFSDDEDAIDTKTLDFRKGAETEDDAYTTPGVTIRFYGVDWDFMAPEDNFEGEFKAWGPMNLNGKIASGLIGLTDSEKFAIVYVDVDGGELEVMVQLEQFEQTISLDDDDVLAILASLEIK